MANPSDKINKNTNFVRVKGKTEMIKVLFSASVAAQDGAIVYPNPSAPGQWTIADSTAGNSFGVIRETIASTDSNFAETKIVVIEVPRENNVEWEFTVGAGTFTQADEGKYADLNDSVSVAVDTSTVKQVFITKCISSTRGRLIFAGNLGAGLALPATS